MNKYAEMAKMFIGTPDMLSDKEKTVLRRLCIYPNLAKFILMGIFMALGIGGSCLMFVSAHYHYKNLGIGIVFLALLTVVLAVIAVYAHAYYKSHINSQTINAISSKAVKLVSEATPEEMYGIEMTEKRMKNFKIMAKNPVFLCDFFGVSRKRGFEKWVIIGILAVVICGFIPIFIMAHASYEAELKVISDAQARVEATYSDMCGYINAEDPHKFPTSRVYTVYMDVESKNNSGRIANLTVYIDREGKIESYYYTGNVNKAYTSQENIDKMNKAFNEFSNRFDQIEDMFKYQDLRDYKYQIEGEFAQKVKAYYNSGDGTEVVTEIEAKEGKFRVYESYRDTSGWVHISPIYNTKNYY